MLNYTALRSLIAPQGTNKIRLHPRIGGDLLKNAPLVDPRLRGDDEEEKFEDGKTDKVRVKK